MHNPPIVVCIRKEPGYPIVATGCGIHHDVGMTWVAEDINDSWNSMTPERLVINGELPKLFIVLLPLLPPIS